MKEEIEIWNRLAGFWNERIGEGNDFQLQLVNPATLALLQLKTQEHVLELACGNGHFSRIMANMGAHVLATDGASAFLELAKTAGQPRDGSIDYLQADLTDEAALQMLTSRGPFDAIVSNMALMDIATLDPLAKALGGLLHEKGRFVFSVSHPAFHSNLSTMTAAMTEGPDGKLAQQFGVAVNRYRNSFTHRSTGIINQPEPHLMFHRPMCELLRPFFGAGWVLDAMEEPAFSHATGQNAFSWKKRPEIPPVLVVRLRRLK